MKTNNFLWATLATAILTLTGCSSDDNELTVPQPQDKTALLQALDGSNIYAAISPNNPLAINSTNKITSVNSCLFFIVAIKPGAQVGNLYPQNLLNFSFTETELTS